MQVQTNQSIGRRIRGMIIIYYFNNYNYSYSKHSVDILLFMIKEIKEKIEKIDPKILIGAAVGGVALLSFFAYKLMSKTKGETPKALPKVAVKRGVSSVSQSRKS